MKIKEKLMKIIKNKIIWIVGIVIILVNIYFVLKEQINKENNIGVFDDFNNLLAKDDSYDDFYINQTTIKDNKNSENGNELEKDEEIQNKTNENDIQEINEEYEKMYIYITGEVNNPGVYKFKNRSRISDAIDAAGGITENADIDKVNLVYLLRDGMKVNIPSSDDLKENSKFEYITMGSGDEKNDNNLPNDDTNDENSRDVSAFKISKVNINTATQTEFETLPGIGPSIALKIINYRKENGKFSSIEELKNVSGIGDNKYENIKDYIYI